MESLVSIIIPTHNRVEKLRRALLSIQRQTFNDFEVIIINDASEDDTDKLVEDFSKLLNIKYIKLDSRCGAAKARNAGIRIAEGLFIAFLDSDDEWVPYKLERQMNIFLKQPSYIGVLYSGLSIIKNGTEIGQKIPQGHERIAELIFYKNVIGPLSTGIVRRECFEKCGLFDERFPACQDWDLWIRIAQKYRFILVKDSLVRYHISPDSITGNYESRAVGYQMILNKYFYKFKKMKKAYGEIEFIIGHYLMKSRRPFKGLRSLFRAVIIYPFKPMLYFHLLIALSGSACYNKVGILFKRII